MIKNKRGYMQFVTFVISVILGLIIIGLVKYALIIESIDLKTFCNGSPGMPSLCDPASIVIRRLRRYAQMI